MAIKNHKVSGYYKLATLKWDPFNRELLSELVTQTAVQKNEDASKTMEINKSYSELDHG